MMEPQAPADPENLQGLRLGAWLLEEKIGQGGMGEVWRVSRADGLFQAQAAIKLLRSDLPTARLAGRFARERAVLARLQHPLIARQLDAGVDPVTGRAYLVLELVQGQPLSAYVRAHCPLLAQRVRLLMQIAEAVDHAHAKLIVHRDLKPSNVLVTPDGVPKLLDFGIAGLLDQSLDDATQDLTLLTGRGLTLGYAAPEQVLGAAVGTAADVFSLGVMLFELLSGDLPFGPRTPDRLAAEHAVLHTEPRRLQECSDQDPRGPGWPQDAAKAQGDLEAVLTHALRKDPAQRYGSVRALIIDLQRWLDHEPVSVRRDVWQHRAQLWLRRNAAQALAGGLVLASLSAGLGVATWQWQRAEHAARQSAQVTHYLTDLLATAGPESHGGQWPTVLQLLGTSRQELASKFRDDPDTRLRLLQVLTTTYNALNRFDLSHPLAEEWVALADQHQGPGSAPALLARLEQGHGWQVNEMEARAIALLEPLRPAIQHQFGEWSEPNRDLLMILAACYMHTHRLAEADAYLARGWAVTQQLGPVDELVRADYLNNLQVLRTSQGRLREAQQVLLDTQPFWASQDPRHAMQILVLRRNLLSSQIGLAEYRDVEARSRQLEQDMDRVLGPASELAQLQAAMLVRYFTVTGQYPRAAAEQAALLSKLAAAGVSNPQALLLPRAEALLARSRASAQPATQGVAPWREPTQALLRELAGLPEGSAAPVLPILLVLGELALLHDDSELAQQLLQRARAVGEVGWRGSRLVQLEGQLARRQGQLPRSQTLLRERLDRFAGLSEPRVFYAWSAHLDLAYTLVLQADPAATATLAAADARRPQGMPPGQPLDAVSAYLHARLQQGPAAAPATQAALDELARLQGRSRSAAWPAGQGSASLGGAFL